jgi:hypothetical protein
MRTQLIAAVIASLSIAPAWAQAPGECREPSREAAARPLPPVQELGRLRFITGGIGVDEARAMRAERAHYPLALTFAQHFDGRDRFLSGVHVEIHDTDGVPLLCATSDGPYLFVDLPAGRYRVSAATGGGRTLERWVTVTQGGRQDLAFVWPASGTAH